jgi:hypothetical protein
MSFAQKNQLDRIQHTLLSTTEKNFIEKAFKTAKIEQTDFGVRSTPGGIGSFILISNRNLYLFSLFLTQFLSYTKVRTFSNLDLKGIRQFI